MSDNVNEDPVESFNASFEEDIDLQTIGDTTASFRNLFEETGDFESSRSIGSVTDSFRVSSNDQNVTRNAENSILIAMINSFQNVEPSNSSDSTNNSNLYELNYEEGIEARNLQDSLFSNNIDDEIFNSSEEDESYNEVLNDSHNIPQRFTRLIQMLQEDDTNETINTNFVVNKAEILLAILKFSSEYGLSSSATADLCKMLNTFVATPFIPDTRYMIDKLFYPGEGIKYHAVCPTCKTHIGEFCKNNHRIFCQVCEEEINVKDPCYRDFFVTLDITDEIQSIIESNSDYYTTVIAEREQVIDNNLQDIYDGRKYKEFIASLPDNHKKSYLTVIFNSDGSPIFKSAKFSIWPIQIIPNEVPMHVRNQKSIVYSLWFGHDKPNMIYFLRPFVDSMNSLTTNGIVCNINNEIRRIHLYALCCCVDAVARPTMQGTTQFNGYYGCNWCLHPGVPVRYNKGTSVKYTLLDEIPARRTAEQTLQHIQETVNTNTSVFGIKKASPLLNLRQFDIIDGFVPDPMHCMDLGIAKQFAEYWIDSSNKPYSISNSYIDIIDKQIKAFKVPTKLVRLSRSIYHRKYWNAAEWENWLLFYSLPVLSQLPNFQNYVQHWSLLVEGYYLLLKPSISDAELRRADKLLRRFVALTQYYYGESAMSFNVHQVSHLSQSVADWGPLWSHSCYPFESGNGHIIKCVHAAKGVLSQICRTLSIKQSIMMLERHVLAKDFSPVLDYCYYLQNRCTIRTEKFGINRYFGKELRVDPIIINQLNLCIERTRAYGRMVKNKCLFKSANNVCYRSDNSFAQMVNGDFIHIQQFIVDDANNNEYTVYKKINVENCFSEEFTSIKKIININPIVEFLETRNVEKLCVIMTVHRQQYISGIPNMHWYR